MDHHNVGHCLTPHLLNNKGPLWHVLMSSATLRGTGDTDKSIKERQRKSVNIWHFSLSFSCIWVHVSAGPRTGCPLGRKLRSGKKPKMKCWDSLTHSTEGWIQHRHPPLWMLQLRSHSKNKDPLHRMITWNTPGAFTPEPFSVGGRLK